jgi:hypothetical protein
MANSKNIEHGLMGGIVSPEMNSQLLCDNGCKSNFVDKG